MKVAALFLPILSLVFGQADRERLAALNREAAQHLAANELDKAEPLLEEALDVAAHVSRNEESAAHARLYDLYIEFSKRDEPAWKSIAFPHLLKALELAGTSATEVTNTLAAQYALATILMVHTEFRNEVTTPFQTFLDQWITELETKHGVLDVSTATAYRALENFPDGSAEQSRALQVCDQLARRGEAPPEFAALLADCANAELRSHSYPDAIRFAQFALRTSERGAPRLSYEATQSEVIEAEAESAQGDHDAALKTIDSAAERARASLSSLHEIRGRILKTRLEILTAAKRRSDAGEARRKWKEWNNGAEHRKADERIQPPKELKQVEPEYSGAARLNKIEGTTVALVLINADGSGKVITMFHKLPMGLDASAAKAVEKWKFRPWLKDGKPVAGVATVEVTFRLK